MNAKEIFWSCEFCSPYTRVNIVKAMVFPVVMYGCESWTIKKAERRRIDAFELWCWRRLLRVPWTARRSNQPILKETSPGRRFYPWVGKISWRRKWQCTPIFLPGEFHGQRSLVGYSPWGHKRVGHDLVTKQTTHNF